MSRPYQQNRKRFIDSRKTADGWKCCYCSQYFTRKEITIEHIIPAYTKIKNVSDTSNWELACKKCNNHTRNLVQTHICNLHDIKTKYAQINENFVKKYEEKTIAKIGSAFVEIINYGRSIYHCSRKQVIQYC